MSSASDESLFDAARALSTPEERDAYLNERCDSDTNQRERVEALLRADQESCDLIDAVVPMDPTVVGHDAASGSAVDLPEREIGNYKLLQKIGEGGFGAVYMAEQEQPVRRKVAIKVIKPGMDTAAVIARFEAERQALAMMDHPNIATVFDGGTTGGRPYFVMELVKGVPVTEYCDANSLSTAERLDLFVTICDAVQHAHRKGIIHRDIKPSNVMVTLHDGKPVIKVIDFGVAKAVHHHLTERTMFTQYGQMIGTPQYMSPEQAEMSGLDIDTRSDIYSLGVLLYELVTGRAPLTSDELRRASLVEMQRLIREQVPLKPSQQLSTTGDELTIIAQHRSASPERLMRFVRGDLDWVIMKALEKDRRRRYESARDFSDDIERLLRQEAITARPPSIAYRLSKTIRKHRVATGILLTLIAATVATSFGMWRAVRAEGENEQRLAELRVEQARLRAANRRNRELASRAQDRQREAVANEAIATRNAKMAARAARQANSQRLATEALQLSVTNPGLAMSLGAAAAAQAVDRRSYHNTALLEALRNSRELKAIQLNTESVKITRETKLGTASRVHAPALGPVSCHPIGSHRLLVCFDAQQRGAVCVDLRTGRELFHIGRSESMWDIRSLRFDRLAVSSPAGLIATVTHTGYQYTFDDGTRHSYSGRAVRLWSAENGEELRVLRGHTGLVTSLQFSADGTRLLTAAFDGTVRVWDTRSGKQLRLMRPLGEELKPRVRRGQLPVLLSRFNDDESRIVSLLGNRVVTGPAPTPEGFKDDPLFDGQKTEVTSSTWRSGGDVRSPRPLRVLLWDSESGETIADHEVSNAEQSDVAIGFVPAADEFVVRARRLEQHSYYFYSTESGEQTSPPGPPRRGPGIEREDMRLLAMHMNNELIVWRQSTDAEDHKWTCSHRHPVVPGNGFDVRSQINPLKLIGSRNQCPFTVTFEKSSLLLTRFDDSSTPVTLRGHGRDVAAVSMLPDGRVVSIDASANIKIWNSEPRQPFPETVQHPTARRAPVSWARFLGDGRRILFASGRPWNGAARNSGRFRLKSTIHRSLMCFDRSRPNAIREFRPEAGPLPKSALADHFRRLRKNKDVNVPGGGLAYFDVSPDGRKLVTVHDDDNIVPTEDAEPEAGAHYEPVRIRDLETGELLFTLKGLRNRVDYAKFSPDGTQIATLESSVSQRSLPNSRSISGKTTYYGGVDVWDANTGERQFQLVRAKSAHDRYRAIHWFPQSSKLACLHASRGARSVFDTKTGKQEVTRLPERELHLFVVSPDGKRVVTADSLLRLWNADGSGELFLSGVRPTSAEFSPDSGKLLATFSDGDATIYNLSDFSRVTLRGHRRRINVGRFSPDGRWVVTAASDSTVRIWNAETGIEWLKIVVDHADPDRAVTDAIFSPDSRSILTTTNERTASIWPVDPLRLVRPRPLTQEEHQRFGIDLFNAADMSAEGANE